MSDSFVKIKTEKHRRRPYFYFFPEEYMTDPKIRSLSNESQGILIDLACAAHKSDDHRDKTVRIGKLKIDAVLIARFIHGDEESVVRCVDELLRHECIRFNDDGTLTITLDFFTSIPPAREGLDKKLRIRILEKYSYTCVQCNSKRLPEVDHIKPVAKGGDNSEGNLQVLCRRCNRVKKDRYEDSHA